jgi:orotate phosphoribosyltransferase
MFYDMIKPNYYGGAAMSYKKDFIKFMCDAGVLTFGEFTLKSGRKAPYFINTGNYKTGEHIAKLGEFYAKCIAENNINADVFFGPAYKGIPLAVSAAIAVYNETGKSVNYCFNRKEAKDHGEGGVIVGHKIQDGENVAVIEDVITAGTAIRETLPVLKAAADCNVEAVIISVDRMEKGKGEKSAVQEVYDEFGIKVYPIVTVCDIIDCIEDGTIDGKEYLQAMKEYRATYGI